MPTYDSGDICLGDRVIIDGDKELVGVVCSFKFYQNQALDVEVSWWSSGEVRHGYFDRFRITKE